MIESQIVQCMVLIQQLSHHLTGGEPLRIRVVSLDEFNLIAHQYDASIGDVLAAGVYSAIPNEALLSALEGLLVKVYTRLHEARTAGVLPSLIGAAQQFTPVANLGF